MVEENRPRTGKRRRRLGVEEQSVGVGEEEQGGAVDLGMVACCVRGGRERKGREGIDPGEAAGKVEHGRGRGRCGERKRNRV